MYDIDKLSETVGLVEDFVRVLYFRNIIEPDDFDFLMSKASEIKSEIKTDKK